MARSFLMRAVFLVLLIPAFVSAGSLDDYYLSRLAPVKSSAHSLSAVVGEQLPQTADRSLTGVRHSARLDWKKLESTTQKTLAKVLSRPTTLAGERTCTPSGGHFTIHYATSGLDAPDLTDANQNGVPDWVETVAGVFEYVYDVEVNKMGYAAPPVTSYDIYLENLVPQSSYGFTTSDDVGGTATSYPSFIEIDKSFTSSLYVNAKGGPFTPLTSLRITAAHEFHHAIQYGYNFFFDIWFAEMTSTWMEDEVYDSLNQLYSYLPNYLPLASTLNLDAPIGGNSEYGRWIFNRYLVEIQGSTTAIRSIWQELGRRSKPADGSDIPMLPVIQSVLQNNLGNNFFGFAKKLLLRDWSTHLGDIVLIPKLSPANTFSVQGTVQAPITMLPTPFTFAFYKYTPSSVDGQDLVISLPNLSSALAVSAFKLDPLGWHEYAYDSVSQSIRVPAFTPDALVYLLVCNNGGDMRDPIAVSPSFPADASLVTDGTGLDANRLNIPPIPADTSSAKTSGGGCFIATAAYGSYLHPKVALLRTFRDEHLLTNPPGRLFVTLYYRLSPPLARVIAEHEWMRAGARVLLTPLVLAVEHPIAALLISFLSGLGVWRLTRRRRSIFAWSRRVAG